MLPARLARALMVVAATATVAALLPTSAHAEPTPLRSVDLQASASLSADVAQLVRQQPWVVDRGLWIHYDPVDWRAASGPALAAAADAGDPAMVADAEATFDTLIATHVRPDGALSYRGAGAQSPDIDTMFFATNLGMALRALGPRLPEATRQRWTAVLLGAATYLVHNGNLSWYTNGNIAIGNALVMALAWKLTGSTSWRNEYLRAIDFAIRPGSYLPKWRGLGLRVTVKVSHHDWTVGQGYFTEKGATGKAGFDADYTLVQLNQLARLWIVTGSPRVLYLTDLLLNTELARTSTSTWLLRTGDGTRHKTVGRKIPLLTGALELLALRGDRPDLLGLVPSHLAAVEQAFAAAPASWNPAMYYDYGLAGATLEMVSGPIG